MILKTRILNNINKLKCFIAAIACLTLPSVGSAAPVFPNPGINLGNTLESTWPGWTPPTKAVIDGMANAGFKTLRVPCAWDFNSTNGTINPAYMTQVTNVVNWAIANGMYVIINEHWDNGWFETNGFNSYDSNINSKLINLWTQVANNFKWTDSDRLAFACANEPDAPSQAKTNVLYQYQQNWINAMRANGGGNAVRWLIIQGPNTNIDNTCNWGMNLPSDPANKRMIEVHNYDPFVFTLLEPDASWGTMRYFWGYNYHVTGSLANRNVNAGDEESLIDAKLAKMKTNFTDRGIPVLIGEFRAGVKGPQPDLTGSYKEQNYRSCTHWDKYMMNKIVSLGFTGTAWVTQNDIFSSSTGAVRDRDQLNAVLGISELPPIAGLGGGGGPATGTWYNIKNRTSGLVVDNTGSTSAGAEMKQWGPGSSTNLKWKLANSDSGYYYIQNQTSGLYLDGGGATANGSPVKQWGSSSSYNLQWKLVASDSGYFYVQNRATGLYLDGSGATANGAPVKQWASSSSYNLQWSFQLP